MPHESKSPASQHKPWRKFWFLPRFGLRGFIGFVLLVAIVIGVYAERARKQMRVCEQLTSNSIKWGFADPPTIFRYWPKSWGNPANNHWCCSIKWIAYEEQHSISEKSLKPKQAFELIASIPSVRWLYLSFAPSAFERSELPEVLAPIEKIDGLHTLSVDTENNDAFMAACAPMRDLRDLRLNSTLSDEGLKYLTKFPNLREFSSRSQYLDGSGLSAIAELPYIEKVELSELAFTASELKPFVGHRTLQSFNSGTVCSDQMLEMFSTCPNIRAIDANGSTITDDGMAFVSKMQFLERFEFADVAVSDAGFAALAACPHLESINGQGCKLTDAVVDTLVQLSELKSLNLANTLTTAKLLPALQPCKHLNEIRLGNSTTDVKEVLEFARKRRNLLDLQNWGPPSWRNAVTLFELKQFPIAVGVRDTIDLSHLHGIHGNLPQVSAMNAGGQANFSDTDIDDSDLAVLVRAYYFMKLDISNTNVTAQGLASLKNQPWLSELTVGPLVDPVQAFDSLASMGRLQNLSVIGSKELTESAFQSLAKLSNLYGLHFDSEIDESFIDILSESTAFFYVQSGNKIINSEELKTRRLNVANAKLGVPNGVTSIAQRYPLFSKYHVSDERELAPLANTGVESLKVQIPNISNSALKTINDLNLSWLDLSNTGLNDAQLKLLTGSNLQGLVLNGNPITDAGIEELMRFTSLESLQIASTQITNRGLAKVLEVLPLTYLDISAMKIDAEAWQIADARQIEEAIDKVEIDKLVVKDLSAAISILTKLPLDKLPESIITDSDSDGAAIDSEMVRMIRGEPGDRTWRTSEISLVPATLGAWPIDTILNAAPECPVVRISNTGKLVEILERLVRFPNLTHFQITDEIFERPLKEIPLQVRTLSITSCKLDKQALQSIAQFRWLRNLNIDNCTLEGCSLEPLRRMALLSYLTISGTKLSPDQLQTLNQLKPTLIDAKGW